MESMFAAFAPRDGDLGCINADFAFLSTIENATS
jgi:hypothetical protein